MSLWRQGEFITLVVMICDLTSRSSSITNEAANGDDGKCVSGIMALTLSCTGV